MVLVKTEEAIDTFIQSGRKGFAVVDGVFETLVLVEIKAIIAGLALVRFRLVLLAVNDYVGLALLQFLKVARGTFVTVVRVRNKLNTVGAALGNAFFGIRGSVIMVLAHLA